MDDLDAIELAGQREPREALGGIAAGAVQLLEVKPAAVSWSNMFRFWPREPRSW